MAPTNAGRDARGCFVSIVDTQQRFWSFVAIGASDACWPWQGARNPTGYGVFQAGTRGQVRAHRFAYELTKGPLQGLAMHRCDNPPCCNPNHLIDGTNAENMADMVAKGRQARGTRHGRAKLTPTDVIAIRAHLSAGRPPGRVALLFGVSRAAIRSIADGRAWGHVQIARTA